MTELNIEYTRIFERLYQSDKAEDFEIGGAGSSKSYSVMQLVTVYLNQYSGLKIAIGRQTMPSLRVTMMRELMEMWDEMEMYENRFHNKTNATYDWNGNHVQFFSVGVGEGGIERIKSSQWNLIIFEEVTEATHEDILQLKLRLRAKKPKGWKRNRLIGMCNPIDENHWVLNQPEDVRRAIHHSTYKDNPTLDADYIAYLEGLINESPNYYNIYVLGLPGKLENIIYSNWKVEPGLPPVNEWDKWAYGLDPGWACASIMKVVFAKDGSVYWHNELHQGKLTNKDLVEKFTHLDKADVYVDAAEPALIKELRESGWNALKSEGLHTSEKGRVKEGIDICAGKDLRITAESDSTLKEIKGYCRKKVKDDDGNWHPIDEPVKFNDHDMDAARYATVGLMKRFGFASSTWTSGLGGSVMYNPYFAR